MSQWITVYQKEIRQQWSNKQLIWVPLVIILLAIMDPISFYYLPELIEMGGGLPEGAVFEMPPLQVNDAVMMAIEQLNMFGVIIITVISMGTIATERKSGVGEIIFVKPLHPFQYVSAKWAALLTLSHVSLFFGLLLNWYYVNVLFGELAFILFIKVTLFYSLWFAFTVTIAIFYNSFMKSAGAVAASTFITIILLTIINMIFGHRLPYFPNQLSKQIAILLETNTITNDLIAISVILILLISTLLSIASLLFQHKKL